MKEITYFSFPKVSVIDWKCKSCRKHYCNLIHTARTPTQSHNYHIIAVFSAVQHGGDDQLIGSDTR